MNRIKRYNDLKPLSMVLLLELAALVCAVWILQSTERTETIRAAISVGFQWIKSHLSAW